MAANPSGAELQAVRDLVERRRQVRLWWGAEQGQPPARLTGLALSGGGIRSATFSLGVIQALAKHGALTRIDILSTVSGGSYIGCFLRSLFMPASQRGIDPPAAPPTPREIASHYAFAHEALTSRADEREIAGPEGSERVRNPLWWLREHSRYLAPNGPSDYGYALALLTRSWVAMLYIFCLALAAIMTAVVGIEAVASRSAPDAFEWAWRQLPPPDGPLLPVSPIFLLVLAPAAFSSLVAVAFWMTQAMSGNEPSFWRQWWNLLKAIAATLGGAALVWFAWQRLAISLPAIAGWLVPGGLALAVGAAAIALLAALTIVVRRQLFTAELRRHLTRILAWSNWTGLILIALAVIDSIGAWLRRWYWDQADIGMELGTAVVLPLFAYFIRKLPDWFSEGRGRIAALVKRFMSPIALLAGIFLYGMLAVLATALVHAAIWTGNSWQSAADVPTATFFALVVLVLALLAGMANGFINLSSLHGYYASRLTRAYLGASNVERLRSALERGDRISENHRGDFIQPKVYGGIDLPGPVHVINATLNETVDLQSQVVARDRKGDLFTVEPGGIRSGTGRELVPWDRLSDPDCAEQLGLGQWCAISGAAASPGMGRMTSLGLALALAFANFRLGYWWWSPDVSSERDRLPFALRRLDPLIGTFLYLWNEMTARYSRGYARKYLSDGGHYENSGVLALIRRGVPRILVSDAGGDPHYAFGDLENLVRMARLDLGAEISLLSGLALEDFLARIGCTQPALFADPAARPDWRAMFVDPGSSVLALALRVEVAARRGQDAQDLAMVWIKPRRLADLPHDLAGYADANPDFPQQTTRDQFFDEAQWESYRKLGEVGIERLLRACPGLLG